MRGYCVEKAVRTRPPKHSVQPTMSLGILLDSDRYLKKKKKLSPAHVCIQHGFIVRSQFKAQC